MPSRGVEDGTGVSGGSSTALVSGLVRRLNKVERDLSASKSRNKHYENEIALLKTQLQAAREQRNSDEPNKKKSDCIQRLKEQRKRREWGNGGLKRIVDDDRENEKELVVDDIERWRRQAKTAWRVVGKMKAFLQDYGLVWVGDEDDDNSNEEEQEEVEAIEKIKDEKTRCPSLESDGDNLKESKQSSVLETRDERRQERRGDKLQRAGDVVVNMELIKKQIDYLNRLGERDVNISTVSTSAVIDEHCRNLTLEKHTIHLVIYRDGVQLGTFLSKTKSENQVECKHQPEFHPFTTEHAKSIIKDVSDGYFPSQLRHRYPNGVKIILKDNYSKSFEINTNRIKTEHSNGDLKNEKENLRSKGQQLGSDSDHLILQQQQQQQQQKITTKALKNVHSLDSIGSTKSSDTDVKSKEPISKSAYLNKLPSAVIRNGRVIEVRSDIANMLNGNIDNQKDEGPIALTETIVGGLMRRRVPSKNNEDSSVSQNGTENEVDDVQMNSIHNENCIEYNDDYDSDCDNLEVTTIQVKTEDRQQTYVLKMSKASTVGTIYRMIDKHRAADKGNHGEMMTKRRGCPPQRMYELRGGYPPKLYINMDLSLTEAGLINASLFMRAIQ